MSREEGNRLYARAHNDGTSTHVRHSLLVKAIAQYEKAYGQTGDEAEKASLEKNVGLSHFAISSLEGYHQPLDEAKSKREALRFLSIALLRGEMPKKGAGKDETNDTTSECFGRSVL